MALHRIEHLRFIHLDEEATPKRLVWEVDSLSEEGQVHLFSCRLDGTHPECSCKAFRRHICTLCRQAGEIARKWLVERYAALSDAELRAADIRLAERARRGTLDDARLAYLVVGDEILHRLTSDQEAA